MISQEDDYRFKTIERPWLIGGQRFKSMVYIDPKNG